MRLRVSYEVPRRFHMSSMSTRDAVALFSFFHDDFCSQQMDTVSIFIRFSTTVNSFDSLFSKRFKRPFLLLRE